MLRHVPEICKPLPHPYLNSSQDGPVYADLAQYEEDRLSEEGFYWVDGMGWVEDEADEAAHLFASDTPLHDAHMRAQADEIDALNLLPF